MFPFQQTLNEGNFFLHLFYWRNHGQDSGSFSSSKKSSWINCRFFSNFSFIAVVLIASWIPSIFKRIISWKLFRENEKPIFFTLKAKFWNFSSSPHVKLCIGKWLNLHSKIKFEKIEREKLGKFSSSKTSKAYHHHQHQQWNGSRRGRVDRIGIA